MNRQLPAFTLADYCQIKKRSNRSGIPGVYRLVQRRESGGKDIYWVASCPTGRGEPKHKFSVTKYGEKEAQAQAIAARRRALRALSRISAKEIISNTTFTRETAMRY